jgi:hypothetical protein
MPATCYRCAAESPLPVPTIDLPSQQGDPFGVCQECSSMACITCGVRVQGDCIFQCVMCFSSIVLLTESLGGDGDDGGPGGGGGGPGGDDDNGDGEATGRPYVSTAAFEALEPVLAALSSDERRHYHEHLDAYLGLVVDYAFDEARREEIDERLGVTAVADAAERARRADLRRGAQRLARDLEAASAAGVLRRDLLADAFGVASYAIAVPPGEEVTWSRLMMLADVRLRFIVGAAASALGSSIAPLSA